VYVLFMNANGTAKSSVKLSNETNGIPTLAENDRFGRSVASLGDLDGDGVIDLAVGASGDDTGGTDRGAVYVLLMSPDGTAKSSLKLASGINGVPTFKKSEGFGHSVASLGDLDGDGLPELALGVFLNNTGGGSDSNRGAVYVLFSNAALPWHNWELAADVSGDGQVAAEDAIDVVNYINSKGAGRVLVTGSTGVQNLAQSATTDPQTMYYDVTGDDYVAADDVITIVNFINAHPGRSNASSEPEAPSAADLPSDLLSLIAADSATMQINRRRLLS
jgi:hypothetical protein